MPEMRPDRHADECALAPSHTGPCMWNLDSSAPSYAWSSAQPVVTHCPHGLDLRVHPRCYLCSPVPSGIFATGGNLPTEHGYTCGECEWGRAGQPRSLVEYVAHVNAEHPTGPHRDFGGDDPKSPFADLEDENADLRMALAAASEELTRLREALTVASEFENEARESLYRLREAAEAYLDAQQALVVWDAKHGYITNSERDALSLAVSETEAALRAAIEEADRGRIEWLLGEDRITGGMERSWDSHGFRAQAATTLEPEG